MRIILRKKLETVYVARCQWACGSDRNGKDIVPFGLLWERKSYDEAADLVDRHAAKTYKAPDGETTRFYHTWLEQVTRYDDGTEQSLMVREYNRPAPESYGTIWVCTCCMLTHANGECCANDEHGGDGCEPLSAIEAPFHVAMGMAYEEHAEECETRIQGRTPDNYECDCETNTFSTSQCEGCRSYLHGERHAMTLFKDNVRPASPPVLEDTPTLLRRLYDAARDVKG